MLTPVIAIFDPNNVDDKGLTRLRKSDLLTNVTIGDYITVVEEEDWFSCEAEVKEITESFIKVCVQWSTMDDITSEGHLDEDAAYDIESWSDEANKDESTRYFSHLLMNVRPLIFSTI